VPITHQRTRTITVTTPALDTAPPFPAGALCWRRAFPGRAYTAAAIRRFTACLLIGSPHADDAVQAVAELAANAVQHTRSAAPGGLLVVEVRRWRGGAAVSVTDQGGSTEPRPADLDALAGHGLGLRLIAATATWWGCRGDATGRTVIAVFGLAQLE
jgi:serine/threonine-protein kinase RsbW